MAHILLIRLARYFRDILTRTPEDLDQVTIEPDGTWVAQGMRPATQHRASSGHVVEVEDILWLSDDEATPVRSGPSMATATPSTSSKRKAAEVIDLTLDSSDDDDEPLARPAKRPHYGTNDTISFNGYPPNSAW